MKNFQRPSWTRDTDDSGMATYSFKGHGDIVTTVVFDDIAKDFVLSVADHGGYENDQRDKLQMRFDGTKQHFDHILKQAEKVGLRDTVDHRAFITPSNPLSNYQYQKKPA
jgi:hypothetical protein